MWVQVAARATDSGDIGFHVSSGAKKRGLANNSLKKTRRRNTISGFISA